MDLVQLFYDLNRDISSFIVGKWIPLLGLDVNDNWQVIENK